MTMGAYTWWEIETEADSTRDTTLACAVWTKNHIEIWAWCKFDPVIGHEVP